MISTINTINKIESQISLGQNGDSNANQNTFLKQSLTQINDTETSRCKISFSDFDNEFRFRIVNVIGDELSKEIIFEVKHADIFSIQITLNGYWELNKESEFQVTDVDWLFEEAESSPKPAFILNTFKAILSLSNKVKVEFPDIDYWFRVSVPIPLNTISEILQTRRFAYRLMVIEKALRVFLHFPTRAIDSEEFENIAFCYHAIVEREFDWARNLTLFPPSTVESIKLLPSTNTSFPFNFPTADEIIDIFGQPANLGRLVIEMPQAIIENYEEAKTNLKKLDGKPVEVIIKSANGLMKYKAITTPTLAKNAFNKNIQNLIDLDEKLDSLMFDKYINSFSDAFEGLNDEQIEAITERPSLDEVAFDF